jgi:predicted outer membrane repeat protein
MNKKNVKIFTFISLIFVTLLIIGGVSAAVDESPAIAADDDAITTDVTATSENVQSNNEIMKQDAQIKSAQLQYTANDYADIKSDIAEIEQQGTADDDGNIDLTASTTYTIDEPIAWGSSTSAVKTLTINGNGATIDGSNTYQFMTVNEGFTLNLNDLIIKNTQSNKGSAIANYGTLNLNNVNFTDNVAQKTTGLAAGAAIYNEGTTTVTDSTFTNNRITGGVNGDDGAAIYTSGALYVYNSKFDSNIGEYTDSDSSSNGANGGAIGVINSTSDFIVDGCTFTNNKGRHGGALLVYDAQGRNQGLKSINGSTFTGNQAIYGGAIEVYNDLIIENSTFEENSVYGVGSGNRNPLGGAICVNDLVKSGVPGSLSVKNVTFTKNNAPQATVSGSTLEGYGGAIYNSGPNSVMDNCTFTENSANKGGAYYASTNKTTSITATIKNSNFTDNTATDGAAIYDSHAQNTANPNKFIVDKCNFEDNVATGTSGSTIYTRYSSAEVTNSNISDSNKKAFATVMSGGVASVENSNINGLTGAEIGPTGALDVSVNNYAELVAIVNQLNSQYTGGDSVRIVLNGDSVYTETEPIAIENTIGTIMLIGNERVIDANGQQFLTVHEGRSASVNNLTVKNAQADNGAAIINHGTLTVNTAKFIDNEALYNGGAIYSTGNLTVNKVNFTNNKVTTHQGAGSHDYGGGAICSLGKLSVQSSNFVENIAAHNDVEPNGDGGVAGAILVLNTTQDVSITTSNFTKNEGRHGGAITINNNDKVNATQKVTINKNNFVENTALYGAAIDTYQKANITNNNFTKNTVTGQGSGDRVPMGAAICANQGNDEYTLTLINNTFKENEAQDNGCGGVMLTMPDSTIVSSNNVYENNKAYDTGVATIQGSATFTNDTFTGNEGTGYTGVFTQAGDELTITGCTFENNNGNGYGDVVYAYEGYDVTITDSTINGDDTEIIAGSGSITATDNTINDVLIAEGVVPTYIDEFTVTEIVSGDNVTVVVKATSDDSIVTKGTVELYVGDTLISSDCAADDAGFNVTVNTNLYGDNEVTIKYSDDSGVYVSSEKTVDLTIDKKVATINIDTPRDVVATEATVIPFTVTDSGDELLNHGTVTVKVVNENGEPLLGTPDETIDLSVDEPEFTVTLYEGTYYYNLSYADNDYEADNVTIEVTASKLDAYLAADDEEGFFDENIQVTISLVDDDDEAITQGTLSFVNEDGNDVIDPITVTGEETVATFNFPLAGQYDITIVYTDDKYDAEDWDLTITVFAKDAEISATTTPTPIYAGDEITITATVECNDEAINVGKLVLIKDDEVVDECDLTTGTATFTVPAYSEACTETYSLQYDGNGNYDVEDADVDITVIQLPAMINVNPTTINTIATDATSIPFTVTSGDEVLTEGTVTLKTVNENGQAIVGTPDQTINLATQEPVFTVTIYEGTYYYNLTYNNVKYVTDNVTVTVIASKVQATIVADDTINGYIDEEIPVVIKIQDGEGNAVTQGTITLIKEGMLLNTYPVTGETTTINLVYPDVDSETITIKYDDEKYTAQDKDVTININKIPTTISVENQNVKVDDTVTITATILDKDNNPVTTGTVQFKDSEGNIVKQVSLTNGEEPVYSYTATDAITEEYTILYKLNYKYINSTATATVTVTKYDTTLTVNSPTVNVDESVTITATLVDENNNPVTSGKVQFKDSEGNIVYVANLANGDELVYTYTSQLEGVEEFEINYLGTYKYESDTATSIVTTNKIEVTINTDKDEYSGLFGEDIPITISIKDNEGNAISQGTISISEDGEVIATITITGEESVYNANYPQTGAHTLVISYNDYKYSAEDVEVDVLAETHEATIITEDFDGFVGDHVVITASVESDGAEVTEGTIRFTNLEGEVLAECDLSNGQASYDYGIINDEFYDEITIEFINSDNYVADSEIITVELIRKYADIELTATEAAIGTPITVTATVTYEDEPVTEGQVVFTDAEGNVIDTINIVDGKASITVTYDQPGTYTINAEMADPAYVSESSIDITINKIPVTIAISEDQTVAVGQTATITATITSQSGVVNGGKVIFTKGTTKLGEIEVVEGTASIDYTPTTSGEATITAKYVPDDVYSIEEDTVSCTVTANKIATTTTLDDVTLTAGKTVTLTARITASDNSIVTEGKVAFKVNGKTLKDANGKVIYAKVVNGVATCEYTVPSDLIGKNVTIEAVYSGSNKYLKSNDKPADPTTVLSGVADIEITSAATVTKGETVTFTVKVTDNGANVNGGKVVLKINGKTLKNADGKVIYANVVDGIASVEYTIPESMKSKDYTLSAVFTSSNYERCETNQTITVQ